jgi:hypothetical protein
MPIFRTVPGYDKPVELPDGMTEEQINAALAALPPPTPPALQINPQAIDKVTGVPKGLRAALGSTPKPEDKLRLVTKYFPDAQPYGDDNFVYKNPKTGRFTLVNPKGLDMGDVVEYGRIPFEIAGGALGLVPGIPGGPVGMGATSIAGSQLAGEGYDALMRNIYGADDTRTAGEMAKDVAVGAGVDIATAGASKLLGPAARAMFGSQEGVEAGQAASRLGMGPLPLGAVSSRGMSRFESGLQQTMTGAKAIDETYEKSINELNEALQRIAGQGAGMSPQAAGQAVLDSANNFKNKFELRSNELYNNLEKMMPPGFLFKPQNTLAVIKTLEGAGVDNPELAKRLMPKDLVSDLRALYSNDGIATYTDMKKLRTKIGNRMKSTNTGDALLPELKQAYAALTKDMDEAALKLGGETARAAQKASRFYRVGQDTIEKQIDPLVTQGKNTLDPEKVFGKLSLGSKTQQQTLDRQLAAFVKPDVQRQIGGTQLVQAGGGTDAFSPAKLTTGLKKLQAGTGQLPSTMRNLPNIEDLKIVSDAFNRSASTANRSNTAGANMIINTMGATGGLLGNMVTGGGQDLLATAAGVTAANLLPYTAAQATRIPLVRSILSDTVSDRTQKIAQLMAFGLNEPVANQLVEKKYNQPSLMREIGK